MRLLGCLLLVLSVCACTTKGATKIDCDGRLTPINPPAALRSEAVTTPAETAGDGAETEEAR